MKNPGKRFEEDIQKSVPEEWFCYRLKDSSGSWSNDDLKSRFTPKNMGDFFIFNTGGLFLYCVECKSFKGKSMPYTNLNDKKGKKLEEMCKMSGKRNCYAGFILNFRDISETYWMDAYVLSGVKEGSGRKSLSLDQAKKYGRLIHQTLKRTRYTYDLKGVLA